MEIVPPCLLRIVIHIRENTESIPKESLGAAIIPVNDHEAPVTLESYQNEGGGTTSYCPVMHAHTVGK